MESPPYLVGQVAAKHGISPTAVKRAIYLRALGDDGRTLAAAAQVFRVRPESIKRLARRFIIDFADYRPFAALERKGLPRPKSIFESLP